MNDEHPHIVIVDDEFLVALDAEAILKGSGNYRVTLARTSDFEKLAGALEEVNVFLLDLHPRNQTALSYAHHVKTRNIPMVFVSVSLEYSQGVPGFEGIPVVMKPYDVKLLAGAVEAVLHR